jgi:hypothetical protein
MCNLACKTKIILNGSNAANMLNGLCYQVKGLSDDQEITTGDELIKLLNKMEDDAGRAQRLFLEGVGFKGPWPKALS